jgi:hypothetical protein
LKAGFAEFKSMNMKKIYTLFSVTICMLFAFSAFAQAPTTPASNVITVGTSASSISINWTSGNGSKRIVTIAPAANSVSLPVNNTTYTASSTYGSGSNLGNSNYCVYNSTSYGTTIFGLTAATSYKIRIYEYNTVSSYEYYLTSSYPIYTEYTLSTEPTTSASSLTATSITSSTTALSFTSGGGTSDLVAVRASTSYANNPVDGTGYSGSTAYGSGSSLTTTTPYSYVVSSGSSTSLTVNSLAAGTTYSAAVFPYNGTGSTANYRVSFYPNVTFTTLAAQPTSASTALSFTQIGSAAMTVSWTSGSSSTHRIVTCKPGTTNTDLPADATAYTASAVYGGGSQIGGASGAFVVYNGTGNHVLVSGLTASTNYCFSIYEYNVASNVYNLTYNYLTTSYLTGFQSTLSLEPTTAASALTFSNITSSSARATWANGNGTKRVVGVASGHRPTGVAFDGTNDYISIPNESKFDYTDNMTAEAWIKVSSFTVANQAIITKGDGAWMIRRNGTSNALAFSIVGTFITPFTYTCAGTRNVNDGRWHHVAATYNGSQMVLYIDGALDAYYNTSWDIDNTSDPVWIGATSGVAGQNFNGQIDEVRLWGVALSNTSIKTNMNRTLLGNEYGLTGYWKLDDGYTTTTTAKNSSLIAGLDGTLLSFSTTTGANSFTSTSGWIHSGAKVNVPMDFVLYADNSAFMSSTASSYYYGNLFFTVYEGPDSTTVNVTNLSPASNYTFCVFDYNGTSNYNYFTDQYAVGEVQTLAVSAPVITSFSPATGPAGTIVTINGTGFNTTASNNTVYFGGVKAVVISSTATTITVQAPASANHDLISVTNNTLTAYSMKPFIITSACLGSAINASSLNVPTAVPATYYPSDQALADIDLDGKPDLVSVYTGYYMSVARNTSTTSAISFGSPYAYYNAYSLYSDIATADFDGDGKIDVVLNNRYSSISSVIAYRNTSSVAAVSFATLAEFPANSTAAITDIAVADFDKDGKPDLVVGYANNMVSFFRNTSSVGTITFSPRTDISVAASSVITGVAAGDLDGDGKTDVAVAGGSGNVISYLRNTSTMGTISFSAFTSTALPTSVQSIAIGDIDSDNKMDIVYGAGTSSIGLLKNNSTSGTITISGTPSTMATLANTVSDIGLGDIDGDGKLDITEGYSSGTQISIHKNNSVGTFSLAARVDYTTTASYTNPAKVTVGDLNGDSKADVLASTSNTTYSVYQNNINPLVSEPTIPATGLVFSNITTSQIQLNFTTGNGANKVVFVRQSGTIGLTPVDGVNYVPNTVYGSGTDLGGGNYCVFNGNGLTVTVTGLQSNTAYTFSVYEYNGALTCEYNYMPNTTSNTATQSTNNASPTLAAISNPAAICMGSGLQTINLTGIGTGSGTEVQTLTITASSSNTGLIPTPAISYTSPAATGSLSYTPVPSASGTAVITVTINDGAANNNTTVRVFTVTVDHTPTVSVAGPNQQICPSVGTLAGNTPAYGTGLWTITATTNPAITITDNTDPNTTVNNFNINDSATFRWTISNGACASSFTDTRVKRKNCPTTADFTVSSSSECLNGSPVVTYTDASIAAGATIVSWSWNFGAGAFPTSATGQGPHVVSYSTAGAKTVSLQVTDNFAVNDIETKVGFVNISDVPDAAGNISGSVTVCQGQEGVSYSVPAINNATGYIWNLPSGATIISGVNTNSITIDFSGSAISGNLTVRGTNSCGNGALSANFPITVNPLPSAASTITGSASVCDGETNVTYSVSAITNASSYTWTVPGGAVVMSGAGTNSITVNYLAGSVGGDVTVFGVNSCGNGTSSVLNVTVNPYPESADAITGTDLITTCPSTAGVTYSIPLVNNASTYNWTVPSGASIVGGAGTNSITVDYGTSAASGLVTVTPSNSCGDGASSSLSITVNTLPDMAGILSGEDTLMICPASAGIVYSISPVFNADHYVWSLPAGATIISGDSTNSITVDFSSSATSGIISVYPENACGTGTSSSFSIYVPSVMTQELCLVTVDDNSSFNKVIWEKPIAMDIDSFRIYREVLSTFVHIASVPYDSLSEYHDSTYLPAADPNTTNFRYKISVIDTCGNESAMSNHHRTIFLQANQGVGGVVNLNWVPYEGATVDFYRILRDTTGTGVYTAIDSVPGSNTVYTDLSPPVVTTDVDYVLELNWSTTCTPTRATVNTSRSNIKHMSLVMIGVAEQELMNSSINVYPNPASDMITVEYPAGFSSYQLQLFDALGQLVSTEQLKDNTNGVGMNSHQMDVSSLPKGMYIVSLLTEYGSTYKRIVVQ